MKLCLPKFNKLCGCIGLVPATFITGILVVFLNNFIIWLDFNHALSLIDLRNSILHVQEEEGMMDEENFLFINLYTFAILYLFTWNIIRCIVTLSNILAFFGVMQNNRRYLKIYLFINVPHWILSLICDSLNIIFYNRTFGMIVLCNILFSGLQILIVSNAYRLILENSPDIINDSENSTVETIQQSQPRPSNTISKHGLTNMNLLHPPPYEETISLNKIPRTHVKTKTKNPLPILDVIQISSKDVTEKRNKDTNFNAGSSSRNSFRVELKVKSAKEVDLELTVN